MPVSKSRKSHPSRLEVSQQAVTALLSAADALRRSLNRLLAAHGITFQQYNVLRILRGAGADGLCTMEIRRRMMEEAPGITGLLDRLEKKGWVERRRSVRDRREVPCRVTPAGLSLLRKLDDPVNGVDEAAFSMLKKEQLEELAKLLALLPEGLQEE